MTDPTPQPVEPEREFERPEPLDDDESLPPADPGEPPLT
jgi:hypothetical protein